MRLIVVLGLAFALSVLTSPASAQRAAPGPNDVLDKDFALFLDWFEGRFDNDRQVFFADAFGVPQDARHERIHSIFRPVDLPVFGEHVFYVEQYSNADPTRIYRQRLYVFTPIYETGEIRLDILAPMDAEPLVGAYRDPSKLEGLTPDMMIAYPQCGVYWTRRENQFVGQTRRGECRVESRRSGRTLLIEDDLLLTENAIWIRDRAETEDGEYVYGNRAGIAHQLRRARGFSCWAAILRGATHGDSGEGAQPSDWYFTRNVFIHDQGGRATVTSDENPARSIELRLRNVDWPYGTNRPSLTLYVHENGSDRATSYAWTDYGDDRIGLNLRWMQVSCTHEPGLWGAED